MPLSSGGDQCDRSSHFNAQFSGDQIIYKRDLNLVIAWRSMGPILPVINAR